MFSLFTIFQKLIHICKSNHECVCFFIVCHVREVHCDRIFNCHLCPKTFKAAIALKVCMHSAQCKPIYWYVMNTLDHLTFSYFSSAKDHIATHTGEKTYKCTFCPEGIWIQLIIAIFANHWKLIWHFCSVAFIWRPNMYSHRKKAHPELVAKTKDDVRRRIKNWFVINWKTLLEYIRKGVIWSNFYF